MLICFRIFGFRVERLLNQDPTKMCKFSEQLLLHFWWDTVLVLRLLCWLSIIIILVSRYEARISHGFTCVLQTLVQLNCKNSRKIKNDLLFLQCLWFGESLQTIEITAIFAWSTYKKCMSMKIRGTVQYPNLPSAIEPIQHSDSLTVPTPIQSSE